MAPKQASKKAPSALGFLASERKHLKNVSRLASTPAVFHFSTNTPSP